MALHFTRASAADRAVYTSGNPTTAFPFTAACWVRPASSNTMTALGFWGGTSNWYALGCWNTGGNCRILSEKHVAGTSDVLGTTNITLNTWNHIAAVCASNTSHVGYLNGSQDATDSTSVAWNFGSAITVGALISDTGPTYASWFDGSVAEACVWNVSLSQGEINALAKGAHPLLIRPANIVFYAPLYEDASVMRDYTAGQRHLTQAGSPGQAATMPPVMMPPTFAGAVDLSELPASGTTYTDTGYGSAGLVGAGVKAVVYSETGGAVAGFVGGGISELVGSGITYEKTGSGIMGEI